MDVLWDSSVSTSVVYYGCILIANKRLLVNIINPLNERINCGCGGFDQRGCRLTAKSFSGDAYLHIY